MIKRQRKLWVLLAATSLMLGCYSCSDNSGGGTAEGGENAEGTNPEENPNDSTQQIAEVVVPPKPSLELLKSDDFDKLLEKNILKKVRSAFPDNYYNAKEVFNRSVLEYKDDWDSYIFDASKLMEPDTIIFSESGIFFDFGSKLTNNPSKQISFKVGYDTAIPFLNEKALSLVPKEKIEEHKKNVATISKTRLEELLDMRDIDLAPTYSLGYLNGYSNHLFNIAKIEKLADNMQIEGGEDFDPASYYMSGDIKVISQTDKKAEVDANFDTTEYYFGAEPINAKFSLVKEDITYPSGLQVSMWLIDDSEGGWMKKVPQTKYILEYLNSIYNRLKGPGGPEIAWSEFSDWLPADYKNKFISDAKKFVSEFEKTYPDGVAK